MEIIELYNEITITPIGTLQWDMGRPFMHEDDFKAVRPTIEEDVSGDVLATAQYCMNLHNLSGSLDDAITQTIKYITGHVCRTMMNDGVDYKVLLCYAKKQQRWDVMIQCNAYKANP